MNDTTKEFDLGELVGGTVASVVEKLPDLSDTELAKLRELEAAGAARATLLAPIDAAIADRAKANEKPAEGDGSLPQMFTQAQVDAQLQARDEQHQTQLDQQRQSFEQLTAQRQAQHEEAIKLAMAKAREQKPASPKKAPVAKPIVLAASGNGPALVALAGSSSIVFADVDDVPILTLPKMAFGPGDYEPAGDRVKLKRDIEFPTVLPETQIASAFILDEKGTASGKAELVMPFGVGGGRSAKLPAGTLSFAGAESYPAPAAAVAAA